MDAKISYERLMDIYVRMLDLFYDCDRETPVFLKDDVYNALVFFNESLAIIRKKYHCPDLAEPYLPCSAEETEKGVVTTDSSHCDELPGPCIEPNQTDDEGIDFNEAYPKELIEWWQSQIKSLPEGTVSILLPVTDAPIRLVNTKAAPPILATSEAPMPFLASAEMPMPFLAPAEATPPILAPAKAAMLSVVKSQVNALYKTAIPIIAPSAATSRVYAYARGPDAVSGKKVAAQAIYPSGRLNIEELITS